MPRPNFWRLKRKNNEITQTSVENPSRLSQKTISSFFGGLKNNKVEPTVAEVLDNVNDDPVIDSVSKRAKLDRDSNVISSGDVTKFKLSESALSKLRGFSSPSIGLSKQYPSEGSGVANCSSFPDKDTSHDIVECENNVRSLHDAAACGEGSKSKENSSEKNSKWKLDSLQSRRSPLKAVSVPTKTLGRVKYTPLEQQVVDLWKQHPGVLLFVECGYKYRFFGKDAEIAAKELNIFAHLDHNFMTASIPVHRLHAHVNRLVEKGYKVGIVKQTETAALKAISDNKSAPFSRKLCQLYTKATLIGEDLELLDHHSINFDDGMSPGFIICVNEAAVGQTSVSIAFVAVNPSTGECIYDNFEDNGNREELYKQLHTINPAEIITPTALSVNTERLINHFDARRERLPDALFDPTNAVTKVVSNFVFEMGEECGSNILEGLTELSPLTVTCLAVLQDHLAEFGLQKAIRLNGLFRRAHGPEHLKLDAATIQNLHLFKSDNGTVRGSLFWALNHTKTKFGARLLYKWLAEPIRDLKVLEERQEAIKELLVADKTLLSSLGTMFVNLPDLDKGLTTILHNKCNPVQYLNTLDALFRVCFELSSLHECIEVTFTVPLIRKLVIDTVVKLNNVQCYKDNINIQAAKDGDKTKLLKDFSAFPSVLKLFHEINDVTVSLEKLRPEIARKLSLLSVNYVTVSGQEYLIEVKNTFAKSIPSNWRKISSTKQMGRFRPPAVDVLYNELQRLHDRLRAECHLAWLGLLQDFSSHYFDHKQAIHNLATLDVLMSLAQVAQQEGYCRPRLVKSEDAKIIIKGGRHPVIPLLMGSANQFVPNNTNLDSSAQRCMVLSGPNMGGKSCYIRQVALIAVLAHLGSYVPAESAEISLLESIYTRMGARDELFQGRSTLMVELQETANILQNVSRHSLVLLDELGRGTGSCDGSAIACATLHHIVLKVQCLTLFVTHYPSVMAIVPDLDDKAVNYHLAFILFNQDGEEFLTFLYEVVKGAADRSYGINVARLANLNKQILCRARTIALDLEEEAIKKQNLRHAFLEAWCQ